MVDKSDEVMTIEVKQDKKKFFNILERRRLWKCRVTFVRMAYAERKCQRAKFKGN